MATLAQAAPVRVKGKGYPASSLRFDWLMTALSFIFIAGLHLDGWAHNHGKVDNSFFTPWHGVLYGAFGLIALTLAFTQFRNISRGYSFMRALPAGYGWGLVGVAIFAVSGVADFGWHSLFGFEADLETLLSPAHLALATGAFLFVSAPFWSTWRRKEAHGWRELFPTVGSLTLLLAVFAFFTQYAGYLNYPEWLIQRRFQGDDTLQVLRFLGIFMQAAMISGILLFAVRRWKLPPGTVTFMLTITTLLFVWTRYRYVTNYPLLIAAPIIAGVLSDILLRWLRPSGEHILAARATGFLVPFLMMLVYFGIAIVAYGITWEIHLWLGSVLIAGIIGLFMSLLVFPPRIDEMDAESIE